jgi:hypothetical protein
LEVITIFQASADARSNSIYIFKNRTIFYADDVGGCLGLDISSLQNISEGFGFLLIGAGNGKIRQTLKGYLFCVRRTTNAGEIVIRYIEDLVEVFRTYEVFVWNNTLDCCYNKFVAYRNTQLAEVILEIGGWGYQYEGVVILYDIIDVRCKVYFVDIEMNRRKICWVVF